MWFQISVLSTLDNVGKGVPLLYPFLLCGHSLRSAAQIRSSAPHIKTLDVKKWEIISQNFESYLYMHKAVRCLIVMNMIMTLPLFFHHVMTERNWVSQIRTRPQDIESVTYRYIDLCSNTVKLKPLFYPWNVLWFIILHFRKKWNNCSIQYFYSKV